MADKIEITAFLNARDKQERPQSIKELMDEFGFTESTAITYYSKWKKEYMSGNIEQTIPRDAVRLVRTGGDIKKLLDEIKALKDENEAFKKCYSDCRNEIEELKTINEGLRKKISDYIEELTESERSSLMAEIDKLKTDTWRMERVICKMTIEKYS